MPARHGARRLALGLGVTLVGTALVLSTSARAESVAPKSAPAAKPAPAAPATPATPAAPTTSTTPATPSPESGAATTGGAADGVARVADAPPVTDVGSNMSDVSETPERTYLFAGLRYRGVVLPKFLLDAFVDGGQTIYSNNIGLELDIRKNGFSIIPSLTYSEFSTGDILYKDKGAADFVGNYAVGNSSLKAIQATVDLLWSTKIHRMIDFEYGIGLGVGFVFGDLLNNWVKEGTGNPQYSNAGKTYVQCSEEEVRTPSTGSGCNTRDHQASKVARVGGYLEPSWANGGSKPNVIPWVAIPQIGLRFKPIKQFESRLSLGMALTGFWFGFSGSYGFERPVARGPELAPPPPPAR